MNDRTKRWRGTRLTARPFESAWSGKFIFLSELFGFKKPGPSAPSYIKPSAGFVVKSLEINYDFSYKVRMMGVNMDGSKEHFIGFIAYNTYQALGSHHSNRFHMLL